MENFIRIFSDYTFQTVALGSALLGLISGVLGCFAVLNKQSLLGDGISHSALPGVILAFMFTGTKNTGHMILGAFITGLLATLLIMLIVRTTRIKFDISLALILSVFFGFGLVLKTLVQRQANARQAGLDRFIYGQASTLLREDIIIMAIVGLIVLSILFIFWKELKIVIFNPEFAQSIGLPVTFFQIVLTLLLVCAIIVGIQTVGVVLMSAMIIAPAVAARQWTSRLWLMVLLSAIFGVISGVIGTAISSIYSNLPTGPSIVLSVSCIAVFSLLFAPNRGIIHRAYKTALARRSVRRELNKL